jgi:hypothetical protein
LIFWFENMPSGNPGRDIDSHQWEVTRSKMGVHAFVDRRDVHAGDCLGVFNGWQARDKDLSEISFFLFMVSRNKMANPTKNRKEEKQFRREKGIKTLFPITCA